MGAKVNSLMFENTSQIYFKYIITLFIRFTHKEQNETDDINQLKY